MNINLKFNQMLLLQSEKIRICKAQKALELIEKFEERIDTMKKCFSDNQLPTHPRYLKNYEFAKIALIRLENYYKKLILKPL